MKKYILMLLGLILLIECSKNTISQRENPKDSVIVLDVGKNLKFPMERFKQVKDSFIYVVDSDYCNEGFWCTKEYYRWNYEYPDTIKVAFTRNGVFEDSVECVRQGVVEDSKGNVYSPAYVYRGVTGDYWIYNVNGKFVGFNCSVYPHSGVPHHYKP